MKIEYRNEPLIYADCAALLTKLFYARRYPEDKTVAYDPTENLNGFADRRQLSHDTVARYARALSGLYAEIEAAADAIPEDIRQFFFTAADEGTSSVSSTLAMALEVGLRLRDVDDPARRERMRFSLALGTVSTDGYPDHDAKDDSEETFLRCLDDSAADASERWNAWSVYRPTDYYLDLLEETLRPFTAIYRKHLAELQPLFDETLALAKQNLADDPKAALAQHYYLTLDVDELTVRPQTAVFLGASLWIMDPSLGIPNHFAIGCCFDGLRTIWLGTENRLHELHAQIKALDDKRRFQILTALKEKPLCGQEICALTGLSPATVSHHMNELVSARFVSIEKVGTRINYRRRADVLDAFLQDLKRTFL